MTSLDWLKEKIKELYNERGTSSEKYVMFLIDQAKRLHEDEMINAIMYALDEDGHTGDWKIKFAKDYYKKLNEGYDFSNKNVKRELGGKTL